MEVSAGQTAREPMLLVLLDIFGLSFALTLTSLALDRRRTDSASRRQFS
jgi:hypothetical protein